MDTIIGYLVVELVVVNLKASYKAEQCKDKTDLWVIKNVGACSSVSFEALPRLRLHSDCI